ncbi:MAG: PTS sugar transporter subunit IIB [Chloroflexi bacterium]|nr:PTS sugar transporter subunit IIB [Chloroflexota bacterium]
MYTKDTSLHYYDNVNQVCYVDYNARKNDGQVPVKKVTVICSTSVVPSTIIAEKLKKLFKENGFTARIDTGMLREATDLIPGSDLVISTVFLPTDHDVPIISGVPFLTGVGIERVISQILEILTQK